MTMWFSPNEWSPRETELFGRAFDDIDALDDRIAQTMYHEAYFNFDLSQNEITQFRYNLDAYLMDTYGVEMADIYDWVAYREAYGGGEL